MSPSPIVILTALDLEYQAVRGRMSGPRVHRHPQGTRFEVGRLADAGCEVALGHVGKGNQSAAVLAERAIQEFAPAALLFVGVAGALHSDIALGDVVVATHIYAFHGGTSEDDGFKSRPRVWETSHAAEQIARHIARTHSWVRYLPEYTPEPEIHFGPIAAGEVVLNSATSAYAHWIRDNYNDARAIEMEGAGIAQAAHLNGSLPVVVVRGVSDRADGSKEVTDRAQWQRRAVVNAAAFAAALAGELAAEHAAGTLPSQTPTPRIPEMRGTTENIAMGNAQVGVQAGVVHGGIRITSEPPLPADLPQALDALRARLRRALAEGQVDQVTYDAVEGELTVADEALRGGAQPSTVTVALRKVRGLIGDVSSLATALAAAITLAQGPPS
ncbi:5'-methylthioadenosine/S-adenosylhomocysteine nucleosidase [Spongiactinospora sp. 9N601]|uniref:5'-methylthioadenosine/S-adenosylhomocysteine nucleosidase n=1 Tax=Spongiactinospora sp. 9N601 TaxID=3375149 RepID=UPI0037A89072